MSIEATGGVAGHGPTNLDAPPDIVGSNDSLLVAATTGEYDDITKLYLVMMAATQGKTEGDIARLDQANEQRHEAWQEQIQALKKAAAAEEDAGFWSDLASGFGKVATVAGVIASVALAVATCGAATPIAALAIGGAVLSSASFAQSQWQFMGDSDLANGIGVGLGITGGLCSLGAGGFVLLGSAAQAAEGVNWASALGSGAAVVSGGAAVGAGTSEIVRADAESDAISHRADAREAAVQQQLLQMMISQIIEEVETTSERETKNVEQIANLSATRGAALNAAAKGIV